MNTESPNESPYRVGEDQSDSTVDGEGILDHTLTEVKSQPNFRERNKPESPENNFAPADLMDGRKPGEWETRYKDKEAQKAIQKEAIYVVTIILVIPILLFIFWMDWHLKWLNLDVAKNSTLKKVAYATLGGTLGGTIFDLKWLYHGYGFLSVDAV